MTHSLRILLLALFLSCSGSDDNSGNNNTPPPNPTPVLTTITISSSGGNQLDLNGTTTTTLSAQGRDQSGGSIATGTVQWSANNSNVTVDQNGLVTAQSVGSSVVTATAGSVSANFSMTIVDSTPVTGTFIYVSDAGNFDDPPWAIYRYNPDGSNPEVFIDEQLAWPQDIVFLESMGEVLISNLNTGVINRHNADTGALINSFASGISGPTRMKIGADNLLYVLQWSGNGLVKRYQLDGTFVDDFTDAGVFRSIGLDWDASGNLYVSSFDDGTVRKFDTNGNDMGLFISSNLTGPTNIWFDDNGDLWVLDWSADRIVKFDSDGNFLENVVTTGIDQPEGVDFYPNGNFIIGSGGTREIKIYDNSGNLVETIVSAGSGGLIRPNAVVLREMN